MDVCGVFLFLFFLGRCCIYLISSITELSLLYSTVNESRICSSTDTTAQGSNLQMSWKMLIFQQYNLSNCYPLWARRIPITQSDTFSPCVQRAQWKLSQKTYRWWWSFRVTVLPVCFKQVPKTLLTILIYLFWVTSKSTQKDLVCFCYLIAQKRKK